MKAHTHHYKDHPTWATHMVCTVCGFAIPRSLLDYALKNGATQVAK